MNIRFRLEISANGKEIAIDSFRFFSAVEQIDSTVCRFDDKDADLIMKKMTPKLKGMVTKLLQQASDYSPRQLTLPGVDL